MDGFAFKSLSVTFQSYFRYSSFFAVGCTYSAVFPSWRNALVYLSSLGPDANTARVAAFSSEYSESIPHIWSTAWSLESAHV